MKAAAFDYVRAVDVEEVCRLLADAGDQERKIIAGGQTLVPLMAMRMARPDMLIDINDVDGLSGVEDKGDYISIGGCTRQRLLERSEIVSDRLPLLAKAVRNVGHIQTRNRGTIGGSIVHGDPSAEIPMAALALEGTIVLRSVSGKMEVQLEGFFEAAMMTAIEPDQILTEVHIPVWKGQRIGTGFHETSSRQGDFAIVAAAAQVELSGDGAIVRAAVTAGGVAPSPVKLRGVEKALIGYQAENFAIALDRLDDEIDPDTDVHATAEYRSRVAKRLVARAVADAILEAG
ncbi:MAG: 6-hydroxypseudooxynicotine dehydrogenase complex subunit alpha [Alphaproteobacteria bacterium MarineAlpha11_Bin1]|nr:MAG: 6-hydroxypseudooxynicotine dehydrogenase complex subunit alpha [Alphaproteobacteria bacterium MarineAlpha11_Bin1]|tara:strand:- start:18177 stop:19043 length:867 start_codon:yes stop_codon:yes gene_type:complete